MRRFSLVIPLLLAALTAAARPSDGKAAETTTAAAAETGRAAAEAAAETRTAIAATATAETRTATAKVTDAETADTVIVVDKVQVTAIKQGLVLRSQPVAATIVGSRAIERRHVSALKNLSQAVPNVHIPDYGSRMTSSIYVRGLGARIDQPVVGLNIDNVPVLNKDCFDTELADAERIEVLRGPQSTLYGRNTMGGVINVYTLSPLAYQGVRLGMEYASGDTYRLRAASYYKLNPDLGMSVAAFYTRTGGFFENTATGEKCDREQLGGGRWKTQWRNGRGLSIDNTLSFSVLDQGGYPYAYIGEKTILDADGKPVLRPGEIGYNDPCSYTRTTVSDGLTVRYDAAKFSLSSITSYQYSDDEMILDQDFLPLSYFTLRQARREHTVTEDLVFRSREKGKYRWLFGAFGFYRHGVMDAPVDFKRTGIEELIFDNANKDSNDIYGWDTAAAPVWELPLNSDFRMPAFGSALYHESTLTLGRWQLKAGIRIDWEHTKLDYHSQAALPYTHENPHGSWTGVAAIDDRNSIAHSYTEILPRFSVLYAFDERHNLYLSVSKGYKAGGFNTQLFSDILQEKLKQKMAQPKYEYEEPDLMSYKPEYSWNYELGGHFSCMEGAVRGDFALFYIDCRDQQLTVFPDGTKTGRMMTNAGRTRSWGGELSLQAAPWRTLELNAAYGYTDARFRRYETTGRDAAGNRVEISYKGNYLPYAPQHTLSASAAWTLPTGVRWLGDVVLQAGVRGTGPIRWNEENTLTQPFYALIEASVRIEHARYSIDLWGRNLADRRYDVFYFKSIDNEFVQRGLPRTFGITLNINI
ncbi:TonB-dependent receptor [Alistipes sp.]|uniref:TonB-dependent receptor n=1 Tax=Alistipes sp. TaxID=1872444 RepID=UPI003AF0CD89